MDMRFLRGDPQTPRGHAIFFARSTANAHAIFCTYCVVPPLPLSLAKYLPSFLASQLPPEELREATNVPVMPIPPMLEEASSLEHIQMLAERRGDDLCDLGTVNPNDEAGRMQLAAQGCQEYGQLYLNYSLTFGQAPSPAAIEAGEARPLDDMDAEELLLQTMSDRQRLAELGKLVGVARYALGGHDAHLLEDTKRRMQRIADLLADKYKGPEIITAAINPGERGARVAELYLERAFKLLDEEYAEIPGIERTIRELQDTQG